MDVSAAVQAVICTRKNNINVGGSLGQCYTIIDLNEVDIGIYLPESDIHRGHKAEVNITFKGR